MDTRLGVTCMVAVAFALTGCGGDDDEGGSSDGGGLDTADIESSLESSLGGSSTSATASGPAITDVSCPDEVEAVADTSFDCTLEGEDGLTGDVTVTLKDETGSEIEYKGAAETEGFSQEVSGTITSK